jgi:hypothetical protein
MFLRSLATAACCTLLATASLAQMGDMKMDHQTSAKALPSPAATANITLNGNVVTINYNSPRLKGRTVGSEVAPYGQVWRTGANPATTLITSTNLMIGTLNVPAGTYTIYTLPSASKWLLIVNKQTGQWGTEYSEAQDLGRTPMTSKPASSPQENMSISFENTKGSTTELHVKWGTTDEYVTVKAQ